MSSFLITYFLVGFILAIVLLSVELSDRLRYKNSTLDNDELAVALTIFSAVWPLVFIIVIDQRLEDNGTKDKFKSYYHRAFLKLLYGKTWDTYYLDTFWWLKKPKLVWEVGDVLKTPHPDDFRRWTVLDKTNHFYEMEVWENRPNGWKSVFVTSKPFLEWQLCPNCYLKKQFKKDLEDIINE